MESIFTKIVKGELPCHKVYEDDDILAFLDIYPTTLGHTLVIPKKQVQFVWDLDEELYQKLMTVTQKLAKNMRKKLPQKYVGMKVHGLDVPHAHIHLVAFDEDADLENSPPSEPDHVKLSEMAKKLKLQ